MTGQAAHIRRFLPRAAAVLGRDIRAGLRSARHTLRALWLTTDPDAMSELFTQVTDHTPTAEDEARRRQHQERAQQRQAAFLRDGRAVYEGELHARPAWRSLVLGDLESRPDVETWLAETVGLDEWYGDTRRVRLIVEDPETPRP
jgi:hypothetical protein